MEKSKSDPHKESMERNDEKSIMSGQVLDYEAKRIKDQSVLETLIGLVKDGLLTVKDASIRVNMSEADFAALVARA